MKFKTEAQEEAQGKKVKDNSMILVHHKEIMLRKDFLKIFKKKLAKKKKVQINQEA